MEPEEIIRAIRQGEVDALVVQEQGQEQIYSLQTFDSVYRSLVEQCFPFGVWLAEPDGKLLYVNPSFLDLLGTDLGQMRQRGSSTSCRRRSARRSSTGWSRSRGTREAFDAEYMVRFGDGSERAIWTRGVLAGRRAAVPTGSASTST